MAIAVILGMLLSGSASLVPGRTVAVVELSPPSPPTFVLQATIPLPKGVFPGADGHSPFSVRDVDGTLVPAQTEIVSRYAEDWAGADVVEILARVHQPSPQSPGGFASYHVVYDPHPETPSEIDPAVEAFLATDRALMFRSRDVYGNQYALDPLQTNLPVKFMRRGHVVNELRTHGTMMPLSPHGAPDATLPHLLGIHSYVRTFAGAPFFELDLRIHNGHSGLDRTQSYDDPLDKLYFEGLALELPLGWRARDADPDSATAGPYEAFDRTIYWIIAPLSENKLHMMPRQAQTIRRLVIYRPEHELEAATYLRDANLAFARHGRNAQGEDLFSWWNPDTARYFPQRRRLPDLLHVPVQSIRNELQDHANELAWALRTGLAPGYPLETGALGWAYPWGGAHGGMAGGDQIVFYRGLRELWAGTNAGWRALAMEHRMYTDRQMSALYDVDGEPTDYRDWLVHDWSGTWTPVWCFLTPLLWASDPFGFTTAPAHQVNAVIAQGRRPAYDAALDAYQPIDFEHYVRFTAPAKALVWIGNDSLAKDALTLSAELFRLSYNEFPNSQWDYYIVTGLGADEAYVRDYPGLGFGFGRLESWGLDAVIAAYATADPAWRASVRPWFDRVVRVVERGQATCTGIIEALMGEQLFNGVYRARQSIEQAIIENMLIELKETVYRGESVDYTTKIDNVLRKSLYSMVLPPCWNPVARAPWTKLAVGDGDYTHPPFCQAVPPDGYADGGDSYQTWCSFAWGYDITSDPVFLERAGEMAWTGSTPLVQTLRVAGLDNLENRAALLALLQELETP